MLDLVGNTPLVRLRRVLDGRASSEDGPLVLAKVEYLNPGGSVKDRIAVRMVEAAEESGELQPGGTIVEPTSGNTGVGLAMVAQQKGYHCVFVVPRQGQRGQDQRPQGVRRRGGRLPDRGRPRPPRLLLQRLGPADARDRGRLEARPVLQPEQPALALRGHRPGDLAADRGPHHPLRHRRWAPAARSAASGATSRSRTPTSRSSARTRPARSTAAAPAGRTSSRASARTSGRRPTTRTSPTASSRSPTRDSFAMTRRLAREEGMLVGGSSGMAAYAAVQLAHELDGTPEGDGRGDRGAAARLRPRLPDQGLQRRVAGALRLPARVARADRRRGAARQERPAARPRAHPPAGDDRRGGADPQGVRRLADARRQGRAARRGGRGGRLGVGQDADGRAVLAARPG